MFCNFSYKQRVACLYGYWLKLKLSFYYIRTSPRQDLVSNRTFDVSQILVQDKNQLFCSKWYHIPFKGKKRLDRTITAFSKLIWTIYSPVYRAEGM